MEKWQEELPLKILDTANRMRDEYQQLRRYIGEYRTEELVKKLTLNRPFVETDLRVDLP